MPASRFLDTAEKQDTKLIYAPFRCVKDSRGVARYLGGVFPRSRYRLHRARFIAEHRERRSRKITPCCRHNLGPETLAEICAEMRDRGFYENKNNLHKKSIVDRTMNLQ